MDERESRPAPDPDPGVAAGGSPVERPASLVDGEDHAVDPRSVRVARLIAIPLTGGIAALPLAFITLGWALGGIPTFVYLPLVAVLAAIGGLAVTIAFRYPAARYRRLRYRVERDGLGIQRGVLWRKTIWIPLTRVQHTDVSQGPLQRKFELARLTVHTAGTEGASISLAGLEHGVASRLADHLRPAGERRAS